MITITGTTVPHIKNGQKEQLRLPYIQEKCTTLIFMTYAGKAFENRFGYLLK